MKKMPLYEVECLDSVDDLVNGRLMEMQLKGWQIAGDILLKQDENHLHFFYAIPMKRKINNHENNRH